MDPLTRMVGLVSCVVAGALVGLLVYGAWLDYKQRRRVAKYRAEIESRLDVERLRRDQRERGRELNIALMTRAAVERKPAPVQPDIASRLRHPYEEDYGGLMGSTGPVSPLGAWNPAWRANVADMSDYCRPERGPLEQLGDRLAPSAASALCAAAVESAPAFLDDADSSCTADSTSDSSDSGD